ncbi:MAG: ATP-binding protein [Nannocystaceae bacterium]
MTTMQTFIWECGNDGMLLLAEDGTIIGANPQFTETIGQPCHILMSSKLEQCFDQESVGTIQRALEQLSSADAPPARMRGLRLRGHHISGAQRLLEASIARIDEDEASRFLIIARDTTDFEVTRTALSREQARFETFFHNSSDALFIHDRQGIILEANRVAIATFGYSLKELRARTIGSLHPSDCPTAPKNLNLSVGETLSFDSFFSTKAGDIFPARIRVQKVVLGTQPVIFSTVTDLRREQLMREQMIRSEQLEAVSRMAGALAHDFNNLLMVALSGSIELTEAEELPDELREIASDIRQTTEQASALASRLTGVARSQQPLAGTTELSTHVSSLSRMLKTLTRDDIELIVDIDTAPMSIPLHDSQVTQILTNLVANASHAITGSGTIEIRVKRVLLEDERCAVLTVSDTGSGMTPEVRARIFEPLYTTKNYGVGTGLGLASVQAILEERGGVIEVHTELGVGTTFELSFPITEECQTAAAPPPRHTSHEGQRRAIAVDDMPAVRGVLTRLLTRWGFEVTVAEDGQDALEKIEAHRPGHFELMITDMMMPRRTGAELTEAAWHHDADLAVIVLTGFSTEFLPTNPEGNVKCLSKPVQPTRLKAAIDSLVG